MTKALDSMALNWLEAARTPLHAAYDRKDEEACLSCTEKIDQTQLALWRQEITES